MSSDRQYYFDINGKQEIDEEAAIAQLLDDGVLFANGRDYLNEDGSKGGRTIVLFVNCSDVFAWGCADAEDVTYDELPDLFKQHMETPKGYGSIRWCCIKRNEKPQAPMIQLMKKNGVWDEVLEKLPDNRYDKICAEEAAKNKS